MSQRTPMKQHAFDAVNGTFAASVITATLAGWTIQEWAAAAALFYSLILIVDKLATMVMRYRPTIALLVAKVFGRG